MNAHESTLARLPPVWLLVLCCALGPLSMTIAVPANTQIMRDFATEYGIAQLILTVYLCAMALSQLFLGALSDRHGRRPIMIAGLIIFILGSIICAFAPSLEVLLLGRAVQGAGGSVGISMSRAIVRDVFSRAKSASVIGYISMAMVLAPMLGPALGGALTEHWSWRVIFALLAIIAVLLVFAVITRLNETHAVTRGASAGGTGVAASSAILFRYPTFVGYVITQAFAAGMFFAFLAGAPFLMMEVLGFSASEYGMYFAITALGYLSGNFFSGRYSERAGPDTMMKVALAPAALGIVLFWTFYASTEPLGLFIPMFFVALSNGLTIPNSTAAALSVRPDLAGAASGISGACQIGVGAALSVLVGFAQNGEFWPLLCAITLSGVCSALGLLFALRFSVPSEAVAS